MPANIAAKASSLAYTQAKKAPCSHIWCCSSSPFDGTKRVHHCFSLLAQQAHSHSNEKEGTT